VERLTHPHSSSGVSTRVLMGFAESLAAPEVAWSLLDGGFRVVAFSRTARPPLRHCPDVEIVRIQSPTVDTEVARLDLERLAAQSGASVLLPVDDDAVWMCGKLDLPRISIHGPSADNVRLALDKRVQIEQARDAGFAVVETQIGTACEIRAGRRVPFPLILRRAKAVEERDRRLARATPVVCADDGEFDSALATLGHECLLAQPLIRGVSEGLFGLASAGRVRAWSAHRRVRMTNPQGSASSACVSTAVAPDLVEPAERFIREIGWNGMFMFELLRDEGGVRWFVEFNGRAWGSMALARRMGFEYPAWAVRTALDPETELHAPPVREGLVCRHLGLELVHAFLVLRGPKSTALQWPSRMRTIREVLTFRRGHTWYNLRSGQRMLFVEDTLATTAKALIRLLRRRLLRRR
jgi:hypothetical protein